MARMTRKQLLKDDEFVEQAKDFGQWLEENWQTAIKIAVGAFALLLVTFVGVWWLRGQAARDRAALAESMQAYAQAAEAGFSDPGQLETLAASFADQAGTNATGLVASFYHGSLLHRMGRTDEALTELEKVADSGDGSTVAASAQGLMTRIWIDNGRQDEAVSYLGRLADGSVSGLPVDQALLMLGRLHKERGETLEARSALQRVLDEFPASSAVAETNQLLAELGS